MSESYEPPQFGLDAFNCPHCGAYAAQKWGYNVLVRKTNGIHTEFISELDLAVSICARCENFALWIDGKMIYPEASPAPLPNEDMPNDVKEIYIEARKIVNNSPRAAAALLRLAIEILVKDHLGGQGKNLNDAIGDLVKKGLPERIQKALDIVRVIGNNAVHPGQIEIKDDIETALALFDLINLVVEYMIIKPREIDELYDRLPEGAKKGIESRDGKI